MTSTDKESRAQWARIETWLAANAPPLFEALRPGVSDEAIARAEARIGMALPDAVRSVYRAHDGGSFLDFVEAEMLDLDGVVTHHVMMNDIGWGKVPELPNLGIPHGPVKPMWWNPRWLPFVGTGQYLCIDLDPASGGAVGQVIEYLKSAERRTVLFPSIIAWLEHWASRLESGKLYFDSDRDELVAVPPDAAAKHSASAQDRPSEASLLLRALVEERAVEASPSDALLAGIARVLAGKRDAKKRARALEALFSSSDDVDELFWERERLSLFLDDW